MNFKCNLTVNFEAECIADARKRLRDIIAQIKMNTYANECYINKKEELFENAISNATNGTK